MFFEAQLHGRTHECSPPCYSHMTNVITLAAELATSLAASLMSCIKAVRLFPPCVESFSSCQQIQYNAIQYNLYINLRRSRDGMLFVHCLSNVRPLFVHCDEYAFEALMLPGVVLEPEHEAWRIAE